MFNAATSFNQDLSSWCLRFISSEPDNFSNSALTTSNKPVWGDCTTKPVATNQQVLVKSSSSRSFTLNASDIDGDALTYTVSTTVANGSVTIAGNRVVYTPTNNYIGNDSFSYAVTDGTSTATAMVSLTISDSSYLVNAGVTIDCSNLSVGATFTLGVTTYTKRSKDQITTDNAATSCTSGITDMSSLFDYATDFNGDISHWDTSSVTNTSFMFRGAVNFNQDISNWDTSNVTDMSSIFNSATNFNQGIGNWDTSKVTNMDSVFLNAFTFDQDISKWNTSSATNMQYMFSGALAFNQYIGDWNTTDVTTMNSMFRGASAFNQYIGNWKTSKVTSMSSMFSGASAFNLNLSGWCVSQIGSEPSSFSDNSALTVANHPNWGASCSSSKIIIIPTTFDNNPFNSFEF